MVFFSSIIFFLFFLFLLVYGVFFLGLLKKVYQSSAMIISETFGLVFSLSKTALIVYSQR